MRAGTSFSIHIFNFDFYIELISKWSISLFPYNFFLHVSIKVRGAANSKFIFIQEQFLLREKVGKHPTPRCTCLLRKASIKKMSMMALDANEVLEVLKKSFCCRNSK